MTKITRLLVAVAFLLAVAVPVFAGAQTDTAIGSGTMGLAAILGDRHDYSVTVKQNGTIAVTARIVLANASAVAKSEFILGLPENISGQITGVQQILGQVCDDSASGWVTTQPSGACLDYANPDYWNPSSNYSGRNKVNEYKKAVIDTSGGTLKITLPVPIKPDEGGAVILSYYQAGQIKSGFMGEKTVNFKSIQDPVKVKNVYVGLFSDGDIYTTSGKSGVSSWAATAPATASGLQATAVKGMDDLSNSIVSGYGWLRKQGSDLAPSETFEVTGKFSANWLGVHWKAIGVGLIILIIIVALGFYALTRPHRPVSDQKEVSPKMAAPVAAKNLSFREAMTIREVFICLAVLAVGVGVPYGLNIGVSYVLGNNYYYLLPYTAIILVLAGLTVTIGYLIFRAVRYGLVAGVVSLLSYIIWLIIAVVIFVAFSAAGFTRSDSNVYSRAPLVQSKSGVSSSAKSI